MPVAAASKIRLELIVLLPLMRIPPTSVLPVAVVLPTAVIRSVPPEMSDVVLNPKTLVTVPAAKAGSAAMLATVVAVLPVKFAA